MPERHGKQREHGGFSADSADMLGVGLQFAGAILLFLFIGRWLDERLDTGPWLLLAGVFIGAAAGFYAMYRRLVILPRARRKQTGEDGR